VKKGKEGEVGNGAWWGNREELRKVTGGEEVRGKEGVGGHGG